MHQFFHQYSHLNNLYQQVVVFSKLDGSCLRSQACGSDSGSCDGCYTVIVMETANGKYNNIEHRHRQHEYDLKLYDYSSGLDSGPSGMHRRHYRLLWCRLTTLATISTLLATTFCITCAIVLYYNNCK